MSNVMSFTGTIVRDAEVRQLQGGQTVCNVTIANNQGFGDRQTTLFIRAAIWGKRAESKLIDYLKKGQVVFVSGELSQSEYKANDGTMKNNLELNCNVIDLVGSSQSSRGEQTAQQNQQPQQNNQNGGATEEFQDVPF